MTRPLLCAVVMVKNEADSVRALLESVRSHVDMCVVLDTGSTDGTQQIVREVIPDAHLFEEQPIRSKLRRRDMEVFDFAANRNRALFLVEKQTPQPVFTIMISGDEELHVDGDKLRAFLEEHKNEGSGAYCVEMRTGTRAWPFSRVLRVDSQWRYRGKIHECPHSPDGTEVRGPLIPGVVIVHKASDGERKMQRILEHDVPVLEDIVNDETLSIEQRAYAIQFLAETHAFLAGAIAEKNEGKIPVGSAWMTHQMTAMSLYWRYAEIGKDSTLAVDMQRVHYALAMFLNIAGETQLFSHEELVPRLQVLCREAPKLPEAAFLLAKHAVLMNDKNAAKLGFHYAVEAAKVARAARDSMSFEVTETTLVWRALVLAADCANAIAETTTSAEERLKKISQRRKFLELAVMEGAPKEILTKKIEAA